MKLWNAPAVPGPVRATIHVGYRGKHGTIAIEGTNAFVVEVFDQTWAGLAEDLRFGSTIKIEHLTADRTLGGPPQWVGIAAFSWTDIEARARRPFDTSKGRP